MQDFGSTPSLLKRPLRGARRRVSTRRKVLIGCVGLVVLLFIFLVSRSGEEVSRVPLPETTNPPSRFGSPTGRDTLPWTTARGPVVFTTRENDKTDAAPFTAANTNTNSPMTTTTPLPIDVAVQRDQFDVPWRRLPLNATAHDPKRTDTPSTGLTMSEKAYPIIMRHAPNTAWREAGAEAIIVRSKAGDIAFASYDIKVRDHRNESAKWKSLYQPLEPYKIPDFATWDDSKTLNHASIFTSLAAFRDHECATTLRDLFLMSSAPHRLYVGISEERKPSDTSCLAFMGLSGEPTDTTRHLLYGQTAPDSLKLELRPLTWADVVQPRKIIDVDAAMNSTTANTTGAHPDGIFLHPAYAEEKLSCVAGELETLRDRLRLHEDDVKREETGGTVFRQGRGGPQQQPSRALAGCRVTTRVTRPELARGPTFGRYITSLFFFDQDYFMVVDSHTRFSVHWDAKLITRVLQLPTPGVLSYYPNGYRDGHEREEFDKRDYMLMCTAQVLSNGMPKLGARWKPTAKRPALQGFAAAGFMFGDAQYVLDTPFDPFLPYMFDGEEVLFSARMWTAGWDIYGPAESNVFHHYLRKNTPKYFSIMKTKETQRRVMSERRTLYLLRRAQPWVQELVTRGYVTADGQSTLKPLPPVEPPESRLIVKDDVAAATPEINVWKSYYGMGSTRTLAQYWEHTELSDTFVKKKDSENRWMGGEGLCKGGY